jgi:tetratricopeptide (TPR) repeat protein
VTHKLRLAEELAQRGDIHAAIQLLEAEVSSTGPTDERCVAARGMLGDLYSMARDVDRAVAHYDAIIASKPAMALAHFKKGLALKQLPTRESQESAIAAFQESYRLGHSESDARSNIAFCCKMLADYGLVAGEERMERLEEARTNFRYALRIDPESRHALFHLGDIEFNARRFAEAIELYRRFAGLCPDDPLAFTRLGNALRNAGDPLAALAPLRHAIDLTVAQKPSSGSASPSAREAEVDGHLLLAEALMTLGRASEARMEYEAVIAAVDPAVGPVTEKMKSCRERAAAMLRA